MTGAGRERAHVVTPDPDGVEAVLRDLAPASRLIRGFALEPDPWDVSAHDVRCAGAVRGAGDARAALLCAARGAWVVAAVPDEELLATLFQDLRRLGPVRYWTLDAAAPLSSSASPGWRLEPDQAALLRLLADGASVTEAAGRLFLSQRTAERRLAAARGLLGVATTAEAVVVFTSRESAEPA